MIARSDALRRGRPLAGKTGPVSDGLTTDPEERGQVPSRSPVGGYWQRESGMYLWKNFKSRAHQPLC